MCSRGLLAYSSLCFDINKYIGSLLNCGITYWIRFETWVLGAICMVTMEKAWHKLESLEFILGSKMLWRCIVTLVHFCKQGNRVSSSTFRGFEGKLIFKKMRIFFIGMQKFSVSWSLEFIEFLVAFTSVWLFALLSLFNIYFLVSGWNSNHAVPVLSFF